MTVEGQIQEKQTNLAMLLKKPADVKVGGDATQDSYDRVPIENFGKNVLGKLGWSENSKIPLGKKIVNENY